MNGHAGASPSALVRFLVRTEPWLPLLIGAAWWAAMYPGLFGEDSLLNLAEARDGPVSVWFTAWWIYMIRVLTFGTHAIPLLTLFGVLALTFSVRQWAAACFPQGASRAFAVCLICATPLVGAFGIQVRHDIEMTAGLLLCAAVVSRAPDPSRSRLLDAGLLTAAVLLIATRHNGFPVVLGAGIVCLLIPRAGLLRPGLMLIAVACGVLVVTVGATRASGNRESFDPVSAVEWAVTDIACLLSKSNVRVSADNRAYLRTVASPSDWAEPNACVSIANLFATTSFQRSTVHDDPMALLRVWLALARDNPLKMLQAHLERMRLFLPPFATGIPRTRNLPFIHSTILPNDFDLQWTFPRIAGTARLLARAWNAMTIVIANAGLWLIALVVSAALLGAQGRTFRPTILLACAIELSIFVAAPMSEGRYGLFILITGQTAALVTLFEFYRRRLGARSA